MVDKNNYSVYVHTNKNNKELKEVIEDLQIAEDYQ